MSPGREANKWREIHDPRGYVAAFVNRAAKVVPVAQSRSLAPSAVPPGCRRLIRWFWG